MIENLFTGMLGKSERNETKTILRYTPCFFADDEIVQTGQMPRLITVEQDHH